MTQSPGRSSTRRMLVLLIAAMCQCHPKASLKLLPRILAYISLRLRDNESKVTDACVILVSAITLHLIPVMPSVTKTSTANEANGDEIKWDTYFESVSASLLKETNAVGEQAVKCICGLLRPVEFDGITLPSTDRTLAHAMRILTFFNSFVASCTSKMNGSTMYSSFSTVFLMLRHACLLARDTSEKGGDRALRGCFKPYVNSIYEAIEDIFQYAAREDWVLRRRGVELLTIVLELFATDPSEDNTAAREYFHLHLVSCALVSFYSSNLYN